MSSISSALSAKEYDTALKLCRAAVRTHPKNAQLWAFQGIALIGKGDNKGAAEAFRHALAISPDYPAALAGAAQSLYAERDPAAIPVLNRLLQLRPADPTSHVMLAVLYYGGGDCETAVQHFEKAGPLLQAQPNAERAYAGCLLKLRQTEKAIGILQKLVTDHPGDSNVLRNLAVAQLSSGRPQDALSTLEPLLAGSNPDVSTMQLAAAAFEANKDTEKAVKTLREAILREPRNIALYADFANIALEHQSFQAGVEMTTAGLALQPQAADLYLVRGVLYVHLAEYDKAQADFERAEQLDPKQAMNAAAQGMVAEERNQNNPDQALAVVQSKLAKQPGDAFLWYLQAAILSLKAPAPDTPEFNEAIQSAQKAVALQPVFPSAHNLLAKLYVQAGQIQAAAKESRLALRDSPEDQTALYHLILELRKVGDEKGEIPELAKRLAKARQEATRQEGERNRYKLVIESGAVK